MTGTIYRPDEKKQKMYWKVKKALKFKSFLSFQVCQKKIVEFTDLTHTFYRPVETQKQIKK